MTPLAQIYKYEASDDCKLSGKAECGCFVAKLIGFDKPVTVSPAALTTWVKNRQAAVDDKPAAAAADAKGGSQ